MRIGFSVFLMAVGAGLLFAVHKTTSGFNIHTVGVILIVAGAIGLVVTLAVFAPRRGITGVNSERTVTTDAGVAPVAAAPVATPVATTTAPVATAPAGVTTQQVVEHREVY